VANQLKTNQNIEVRTQSPDQNISPGASCPANARIGDSMIDDIFISDRVISEVAEYRATMNAALWAMLRHWLRVPYTAWIAWGAR